MNIGAMRQRICLLAPTTTQDDYGEPATTYNEVLQCWASVNAITSRELYSVGGFTSQVTHKVSIRYPQSAVSAGMRVHLDSRTFNVQAVSDPDERKATLNLLCQELNGTVGH